MKVQSNINESDLNPGYILDVRKIESPIELKIDQITDYGALTFTLIISAIVSAITAFVTIYLVTKSNNKLIESQRIQSEKQLIAQEILLNKQILSQENQKNKELNSHSRQIWIDKLRDSASKYLYYTNLVTIQALSLVNTYNTYKQKKCDYSKLSEKYNEIDITNKEMEIAQISISLSLDGTNTIDEEIKNILVQINLQTKSLNFMVIQELTNKVDYKVIDYETLKILPEVGKIHDLERELKNCFQKLFKENRNFY